MFPQLIIRCHLRFITPRLIYSFTISFSQSQIRIKTWKCSLKQNVIWYLKVLFCGECTNWNWNQLFVWKIRCLLPFINLFLTLKFKIDHENSLNEISFVLSGRYFFCESTNLNWQSWIFVWKMHVICFGAKCKCQYSNREWSFSTNCESLKDQRSGKGGIDWACNSKCSNSFNQAKQSTWCSLNQSIQSSDNKFFSQCRRKTKWGTRCKLQVLHLAMEVIKISNSGKWTSTGIDVLLAVRDA